MVRAPCCEKMGLKKGPWTADEDRILISYITRYGHGNWRALPKEAGLLRCGKSCRLRWTNYLRPDIKRGNFTREEEDTIISLHEMLGNRWSAIAARLPGRTDNEIKNVWHTHIKKRLKQNRAVEESKESTLSYVKNDINSAITMEVDKAIAYQQSPILLEWSHRDISSSGTNFSSMSTENNDASIKDNSVTSSQESFHIDESFWLEALSMENSAPTEELINVPFGEPLCTTSPSNNDDNHMNFWLKIFMETGDLLDLP